MLLPRQLFISSYSTNKQKIAKGISLHQIKNATISHMLLMIKLAKMKIFWITRVAMTFTVLLSKPYVVYWEFLSYSLSHYSWCEQNKKSSGYTIYFLTQSTFTNLHNVLSVTNPCLVCRVNTKTTCNRIKYNSNKQLL